MTSGKETVITYTFSIKNNLEQYSKCANFINHVINKRKIDVFDSSDFKVAFALNDEFSVNDADIRQVRAKNNNKRKVDFSTPQDNLLQNINDSILATVNKAFHFIVDFSDPRGDDYANLQYFFLIKQMFPELDNLNRLSLVIKPPLEDPEASFFYKLSHFLSLELIQDPNCCFRYDNGAIKRLPYSEKPLSNISQLRSFFPLIEITEENFRILTSPIKEYYLMLDKEINNTNQEKSNLFVTYKDGNITKYNLGRLLFLNSFEILKSDKSIEKTGIFSHGKFNSDFYEIIKDLPLLTLMFFSVGIRANAKNGTDNQIALYEAADYAEGILQLIENVVEHSKNKVGYFCFRLLKTKRDENNNFNNAYLNKEYTDYGKSYFGDLSTEIQELSFLELHVVDVANFDVNTSSDYDTPVVDVFFKNLQQRIKNGEADLVPLIPENSKLNFMEFFGKSDVLAKYEAHSSNITRHYGLKRFSNSVSAARGYFLAVSTFNFQCENGKSFFIQQNTSTTNQILETASIPGTKYQVLLPLNRFNFRQEFVGIDTNLKWIEKSEIFVLDKWIEIPIYLHLLDGTKSEKVASLGKQIIEAIINNPLKTGNSYNIFSINISENFMADNNLNAELIAKALLFSLANTLIKDLDGFHFVLHDCPTHFIPEFIHNMMVAFDRFNNQKSTIIRNRQIYCYSKDNYADDFLIMGNNLKEVRYFMLNRSAIRGSYPSFISLLNYILGKQSNGEVSVPEIDEIPFDLLIRKGNKTLFEKKTERILNNNILESPLGCKITDTHIRIGSKIHVHNFFDAEILFQNNYFTIRFAALLVKDIYHNLITTGTDKIRLIGYGNYSEMLLNQAQSLLSKINSDSLFHFQLLDYNIRNQKDIPGHPIDGSGLPPYEGENFVFIVPINSTLTTHNKLHSIFSKSIKEDNSNVLCNFAIILVRDENERSTLSKNEHKFWEYDDGEWITTKLVTKPVRYYVSAKGLWEDPIECSMCFPSPSKLLDEKPIIETNITSVIPSLQLEPEQNKNYCPQTKNTNEFSVPINIPLLEPNAIYKHVYREENHYLFYFKTNELLKRSRKEITNWLEGIDRQNIDSKTQSYNFLVSPLNESNPSFLDLVNQKVFFNTAQILRFEVNREYRNNFMTKYSYIADLKNNILAINKNWPINSEINFFYVDDGIISGKTIERAKSLINSLVSLDKNEGLTISVFKGIFVLINRLSKDSIQNYIDKIEKYYYFSNFPVSSIRNSPSFCYLCKKSEDYYRLADKSTLIDMHDKFIVDANKFIPEEVDGSDVKRNISEKTPVENYKSAIRTRYAAKLSQQISNNEINSLEKLIFVIIKEICVKNKTTGKYFLKFDEETKGILESYLKLLARPFFVYRYSIREILLQLLNFTFNIFQDFTSNTSQSILINVRTDNLAGIINNYSTESNDKYKSIYRTWVEGILVSPANKVWLFNLLVEQFTELNSTRLFRKNSLNYFCDQLNSDWFSSVDKNNLSEVEISRKASSDPLLSLRYAINQTIKLSRDESKSLWLEYLLVKGQEYHDQRNSIDKSFLGKLWGNKQNLGLSIFLENTKLIQDGINELTAIPTREAKDIINPQNYYLENFRKLLNINGFELEQLDLNFPKQGEDIQPNTSEIPFYGLEIVINAMIALQKKLNNNQNEKEQDDILLDDIQVILQYINAISQACCSQIIIIPVQQPKFENEIKYDIACPYNLKEISRLLGHTCWGENFRESKANNDIKVFYKDMFNFETFKIIKNQLIVRIINDNEDFNVFLSIIFSDESKKSRLEGMEYAFATRNVLLFRNQLQSFIEKHINAKSLQSWVENNAKEKALRNPKTIIHPEDDSYLRSKIREFSFPSENEEILKYSRKMQAIILKLLADINISSLYHDSIMEKKYKLAGVKENVFDWGEENTLPQTFTNDILVYLIQLIADKEIVCCWDLPDHLRMGNFYLETPMSGFSLLISIIENAIKYSPQTAGKLRLFLEPYKDNTIGLSYFCITNTLNVSEEEELINLRTNLESCLLTPPDKRKLARETGVTLYTANLYCKQILIGLKIISPDRKKPVIEYEISDGFFENPSTYKWNLTIKVPIIYRK